MNEVQPWHQEAQTRSPLGHGDPIFVSLDASVCVAGLEGLDGVSHGSWQDMCVPPELLSLPISLGGACDGEKVLGRQQGSCCVGGTQGGRDGVDGPRVDGPGVDGPRVDAPRMDRLGVDGPGVDGPGVDRPWVDAPMVDGPR